jgi:DNA replication protein DnaC
MAKLYCKDCRRAIWEPDEYELAELPPMWLQLGQCPACILDPSDQGIEDPVLKNRLDSSGLPRSFRDLTIDKLVDEPALEPAKTAARTWAREGGGLFLHGPVGTGKTYIAAAATVEALALRPLRWRSVPQLVLGLRADYGTTSYADAHAIVKAGMGLVLDDLGQEHGSGQVAEVLFAVIDERLAQGLPVLITSNLLPSELGARYGAWLPSRIRQMNPIRVPGVDRRLEIP